MAAPARFTREHPCPICGGWEALPRGQGRRCAGFLSADRRYAHCSREEHGGTLPLEGGNTYAHRLDGPCSCGGNHLGTVYRNGNGHGPTKLGKIVARYPYHDETGALLFEVVRFEPKEFRQKRATGEWGLGDTRRVLYRLPQLLAAPADAPVFIAEGEKGVEALTHLGAVATCSPMGAGKWRDEYSRFLKNRRVVILPDADEPGERHAADIARSLAGVAASVHVLRLPGLPPKGDAFDWVAAGGTREALAQIVAGAPAWQPPEPPASPAAAGPDEPKGQPRYTDIGNAERLVAAHGADFRYCAPFDGWMVWTGRQWLRDQTGEIERRAKQVALGLYHEAAELADDSLRDALLRHAKRSNNNSGLLAMVRRAQVEPGIPALPEDFDAHLDLLAAPNGTLALQTAPVAFREHRRADLITKLLGTDYQPDADCPRWLAFLDRVLAGNRTLIEFLHRAVGYSLSGETAEQCLLLLYGTGANGKSTFLETLLALFGSYGAMAQFDTFLEHKGDRATNDLAALVGVRFVCAVEPDAGKRLSESVVKQITGGDTITARFLHKEFFSYRPQFKVWLAANHKPTIRGTDEGIWRRIRLVPFTVQIPEAERDPRLKEKLCAELPGILAWAVRGYEAWQREGLGMPDAVRQATEAYRTEMDVVGAFLAECCVQQPQAYVASGALYAEYTKWCERTGEKPLTQRALAFELAERGFTSSIMGTGNNRTRSWQGLGLLSAFDAPPDSGSQDPLDRKKSQNQGSRAVTLRDLDNLDFRDPKRSKPSCDPEPPSDAATMRPKPRCPRCDVALVDGWCPKCEEQVQP